MHAPKEFAAGVAILCLAAFFVRNHYRRWCNHFGDTVDDYINEYLRGYVLTVVVIGFLFLLGGAMVYASFVPDGQIDFTSNPPFVRVTSKAVR